jgi:uncharacterized protein DUF1569
VSGMSSVFDPAENAALSERIRSLRPDAKALWGGMSVAQMLAHCQRPLRVATGELRLERNLLGILLGRLAKKQLAGPVPFRRGLPTAPAFRVQGPQDFAREQEALLLLLQRFAEQGPAILTRAPHPFFGPLTEREWDVLQWKHLDHHLRQFGV